MEITTTIKFKINYQPLNKRNIFESEAKTSVINHIKETTFNTLITLYKNTFHNTIGYYYKGKIYEEVKFNELGDTRNEEIDNSNDVIKKMLWWHINGSQYYARTINFFNGDNKKETFEEVIARLKKDLSQYLIVEGKLFKVVNGLPCYQIMTFGLGHNHGGTGLLVTYYKNPKQVVKLKENKGRVFLATDWEKALESAKEIAIHRGDTESIKHFRKNISINVNFYDKIL